MSEARFPEPSDPDPRPDARREVPRSDEMAERVARRLRAEHGALSPGEMADLLKQAYREEADAARASDPSAETLAEDLEDLSRAVRSTDEIATRESLLGKVGPGVITGAADDDPSGIGTYSVVGAQFGYSLLWLVTLSTPLMMAVQEMCGRLGRVTGQGLAAVLSRFYPRSLVLIAVTLLTLANVINIWADLNVMAGAAQMLAGGSFGLWLAGLALSTVLLEVFVPYRLYVRYLKWLCLSLLAYVVTALLPWVHKDWGEVARSLFVPSFRPDAEYLMAVVGFLGTTISPYLFFWQAAETVEEAIADGSAVAPAHPLDSPSDDDLRGVRADTATGMAASQAVTFFIVLCTASTLRGQPLQTAQDAARALQPLGGAAYGLFTLGIIGTGLLAIPTMAGSVAYAVCEVFGWRYGLYRRLARARAFYATIAVTTVAGYLLNLVNQLSAVRGLLYAAVINGIVAPPLIALLLLACNDRRVVGRHVNGWLSNLLGGLAIIVMGGAAMVLVRALLSGAP